MTDTCCSVSVACAVCLIRTAGLRCGHSFRGLQFLDRYLDLTFHRRSGFDGETSRLQLSGDGAAFSGREHIGLDIAFDVAIAVERDYRNVAVDPSRFAEDQMLTLDIAVDGSVDPGLAFERDFALDGHAFVDDRGDGLTFDFFHFLLYIYGLAKHSHYFSFSGDEVGGSDKLATCIKV